MRPLRLLREAGSKHPLKLAFPVALLAAGALVDAAGVFTLAAAVEALARGAAAPEGLSARVASGLLGAGLPGSPGALFALFLVLFAAANGAQVLARWAVYEAKHAVLRDLYAGTFSDFFRARWPFFSQASQGTLLNAFLRELPLAGDAIGALLLSASSALQLGVNLAVPLAVAPRLALACLGATLACALPFWAVGRWSRSLGRTSVERADRVARLLHESFSQAKLVLGFGNQARAERALDEAYAASQAATVRSQTVAHSLANLYHPLGMAVLVGALLAARPLGVPLAETLVVLLYLAKSIPVIGQLVGHKNQLETFVPSLERVAELRAKAVSESRPAGGRRFGALSSGLRLERVVFSHPGRPPALDGVCLEIPKGGRVALTGPSGAGKSTVLDLLLGLIEPQAGAVLVDGTPLAELDGDSYRARVGCVPQGASLLRGTIRENLLWANPAASDEELLGALRRAQAEAFVSLLPKGIDTEVGDRGVLLSGGQVQRLALARALVRSPDLLLLDEATNALDAESERLIELALASLGPEVTVVTAGHAASIGAGGERVFVLDGGCLVEGGPQGVAARGA